MPDKKVRQKEGDSIYTFSIDSICGDGDTIFIRERKTEKRKLLETVGRGSFTIEAALLMPLIIAVLLFVLYAGFYLHDSCVLRQKAYLISQKASQLGRKEERGKKIQDMISSEVETSLLVTTLTDYDVHIERTKIRITINGSMQFFQFGILKNIFHAQEGITAVQETDIIEPLDFIRNCRNLKEFVR